MNQNHIEAAHYYKLAADRNHISAQCNYGICLQTGRGLSVDLDAAAKYYKLSADSGFAPAQFNYGLLCSNAQNHAEAEHYFKLAADQGHAQAQCNYGLLCANGNLAEAAHYYKLSADQGFAPAQFNYGGCAETGRGVQVDLAEAIKYYKFAADQKFPPAQLKILEFPEAIDGTENGGKKLDRYALKPRKEPMPAKTRSFIVVASLVLFFLMWFVSRPRAPKF
jgi:TPR repeat protein